MPSRVDAKTTGVVSLRKKGRGTQKRGGGECQSCWLKTDGLCEEGGTAEARAAVTL